MIELTADTIRAAREHLHRYGLCKDGTFGKLDGACCTVGHIAAVLGGLDPDRPKRLIGDCEVITGDLNARYLEWKYGSVDEWPPDDEWLSDEWPSHDELVVWNDERATVADVDAFYVWLIERLEQVEVER